MADGFFLRTAVEIFPDRINALINTPDGPIGQAVHQAAEAVLQAAIPKIGTRYSGHHGAPLLKDSGRVVSIGGSAWSVAFGHDVAFLHHEGKRSGYTITPHDGERNILANPNVPARSAGGPFFARGPVIWTGNTAGNPYLTDAAREVGLRPSGALGRENVAELGRRLADLFRLPAGSGT